MSTLTSLPGLEPSIANAAYIELRATLPWLFDDDSEEMILRCRLALGALNSLRPATGMEAYFAVQVVATQLTAADCMRQSYELGADFHKSSQSRAQALAMMRLGHRAVDKLVLLQQNRKAAAALTAMQSSVTDALAEAFGMHAAEDTEGPPPDAAAEAAADVAPGAGSDASRDAPAEASPHASWNASHNASSVRSFDASPPTSSPAAADAPPAASSNAGPDAMPTTAAAGPSDKPITPDALQKAAAFIRQNRLLAMRIRRAGGLTWDVVKGFRPTSLPRDPAVIDALVRGTSPLFESLDVNRVEGEAA